MQCIWALYPAVLLLATLVGCAARDLPTCRTADAPTSGQASNQPSSGKSIILARGRYDPPITIDDHNVIDRNARPRHEITQVSDPVSGAAAGALGGVGFCGYFVWLPPLALACLPVGAAAGAVAGGALGGVAFEKENSPEGRERAVRQRAFDEQTAARQRTFDEQTADRKAAEGHVAAVVHPVDLNSLLLEEARRYARKSDLGDIPELLDQGPESPDDHPKYQTRQDYVLEIVLTERTVVVAGSNASPRYQLGFSARGRLIRVADNAVVHVFTTHEATHYESEDVWTANNGALLIAELSSALRNIAKTAVDQWTRAAIDTTYESSATVVVIRPHRHDGAIISAPISIDGCLVGHLPDNTFLKFRTSAGEHSVRPERIAGASSDYSFVEYKVGLRPGQTYYLRLNIGKSWYLMPVPQKFGEEFVRTHKESGQESANAFPDGR